MPVVTCPGPGGPVTFSSATYVTYHVTVNMMYHVIIGWDADRVGLAGRAAGRGTGPGQAGGDVHLVFAVLR
jgi:hypothetical protein